MASETMDIHRAFPLKNFTTFHIGGNADYFVSVKTIDSVREALRFAKENALHVTILGGGSNVLVKDSGVRGIVIKIDVDSYEAKDEEGGVRVIAGAGMNFDALVDHTVQKKWWGLENLSHIPGTVGATPIQNVGAYGREVADIITRVRVMDRDGVVKDFDRDACMFSYRDSYFKSVEGKKYVVLEVEFHLSKKSQPMLEYKDLAHIFPSGSEDQQAIRDAVIAIRSRKFPDWKKEGTAGSFFKNPRIERSLYETLIEKYPELPGYPEKDGRIKVPLGWILDRVLNLRGFCVDDVCSYEHQALVLVNKGNATASDVLSFARQIEEKVFTATGIIIEKEITIL